MSIVRTFAINFNYAADSNQELVALGLANIFGSFFLRLSFSWLSLALGAHR